MGMVGQFLGRLWFCIVHLVSAALSLFRTKKTVRAAEGELFTSSATNLAHRIRRRELRSVDLVKALTSRIREVEDDGLRAVAVENFEATLRQAQAVDDQLDADTAPPEHEAPFLGVPFTLKDCIFVEGLRCTAGIPCRREAAPQESDAECVQRLRRSGAIGPLAVTNVSELCMWWETSNGIFGRSVNPYDSRRIVGGSSGGEGSIISAAGSIFGIGTDIGGSIRMPCYFNGIFGHKPSPGSVSGKGMKPPISGYQVTMCTAGPMCRYAEDLAPMLKAMLEPDSLLAWNLTQVKRVKMSALKIFYMEEIRSGSITPMHLSVRNSLKKVVKYMDTKHDCVCIRVDLPLVHSIEPIWFNDMNVEGAPPFAVEMADRCGEVRPSAEFAKSLVGLSEHTAPAIALALLSQLGSSPHDQDLVQMRQKLRRQLGELLQGPAVFLFPSHPTLAPFHNQTLFQPFNFMYTGLFNSLGLPVTQCPLGLSPEGLPTGVQVVADLNQDHLSIAVAEELERGFGGWAPSF